MILPGSSSIFRYNQQHLDDKENLFHHALRDHVVITINKSMENHTLKVGEGKRSSKWQVVVSSYRTMSFRLRYRTDLRKVERQSISNWSVIFFRIFISVYIDDVESSRYFACMLLRQHPYAVDFRWPTECVMYSSPRLIILPPTCRFKLAFLVNSWPQYSQIGLCISSGVDNITLVPVWVTAFELVDSAYGSSNKHVDCSHSLMFSLFDRKSSLSHSTNNNVSSYIRGQPVLVCSARRRVAAKRNQQVGKPSSCLASSAISPKLRKPARA
ncbi:hypothetical protein EDC96DRAFT_542263 [Choanephora cucurbitarum]|nr:hypothetical protein EDC96DRAFT_542263 [Choanephora cucurbitarum]